MIDELRKNLEQEKKIISDMSLLSSQMSNNDLAEKKILENSLDSLKSQLSILNNAVPSLLDEISPAKKLSESTKESKDIVKFSYVSPITNEKTYITLNKKDKDSFIEELKFSESSLLGFKRKEQSKIVSTSPSSLARISNIVFLKTSEKISRKFTGLNDDLKKANIRFMISTYLSIALFVSMIVFVLSFLITLAVILVYPDLLVWAFTPFVLTGLSLFLFYLYPAIEKGSVEKQILYELPFATIHMAAIAGSDIAPIKIFKIIAMSSEYPNVGREMKKLINQTDIYGYDLVTALKNAAKQTSNSKLAELFSGLATNIISGGDLKNYLEKKAENFLLDYKLERQKYSAVAETFMDVYISILIAAPLVLMLMFIIMNLTGLTVSGLSLNDLLIFAVGGVALINVIFLVVLHIKQPKT